MQLVARVEKLSPPSRTAVCAAAASAVMTLLADERCAPGGQWHPQVSRWLAGRIRKHCRRARGTAWDRVLALPGATATVGTAHVRAFVPSANDAIARDLAKLQLSGTELEDPDVQVSIEPGRGGPVVVSICPDPVLPFGKAAAAAGHAAQLSAMTMPADRLARWDDAGFPVVVEHPEPQRWAAHLEAAPVIVRDGGFTVVAPGTVTSLARWG